MSDALGRWFSARELACRGSGEVRLHPDFANALVSLRVAHGRPMVLTSACRRRDHNARVGGAARSYHLLDHTWPDGSIGTLAVDVRVGDAVEAWRLGGLAIDLGWSVGVSTRGFLHLDMRSLVGEPAALFGYP
jgi:hypothetical protein